MTLENFNTQMSTMDRDSMETMVIELELLPDAEMESKTDDELRAFILASWTPEQIADIPEDMDLCDWGI